MSSPNQFETPGLGFDIEKNSNMSKIETTHDGEVIQMTEGTKRAIKSRHAQMIAIGGCIGTSLFIASGQSLHAGGPALLLIAYVVMSCMVYGVATAVVEVGAHLPVPGASMSMHCSRYVSKSLGVALGYLYFYSFGILTAYETTAAVIVIDFWPNSVPVAAWITLLLLFIIILNFFPVHVYAEAEFWFASIKVVLIVGLLILSLVLILGGGPSHHRLGFYYWENPGAINAYIIPGNSGRFVAFLYCWVQSGFSFYFSPEQIVVTSGEMKNPRQNLPRAARSFFYRLAIFYILSTIAIGAICASNSQDLVSGAGNANASPWVIAIRTAGIDILPSIVNAGILTSAWSSGTAYLYVSSRSLYSLAVTGHAPKLFTWCNRWGLPYNSVLASCLFAPLAYLTCSTQGGVVFNWFVNLTNTAGHTSWIICCVTYMRFRKARKAQGIASTYSSRIQPYAARICVFLFGALLLLNGFYVFLPGRWSLGSFLSAYLGIPIFLFVWIGHKLTLGRSDPWIYAPQQVDLTTGLDAVEADSRAYQEEKAILSNKNTHWQTLLQKLFK
ncbi:AAT family amino acid transporter [Xylaria sp. FL1042]|nr:AAT family amino acid transporter [Xylaria sp. FL1042]